MTTATLPQPKQARQIVLIPMAEIIADSDFNCRGRIDPRSCTELAYDISKNGLLSPPIVRPYVDEAKFPGKKYALVAGFRRFMAHIINRASFIEVEVKTLTDSDAAILNLTENLEREDLNLMQEARAFQKLQKYMGFDSQMIADKLHRSLTWVEVRLMALDLEPEIQTAIEQKFLTQNQIKEIHSLPPGEPRYEAVRQYKTAKLRGDKRKPTFIKKKQNVHSKKKRDVRDIFEMQDHMLEEFGNGNLSRCPIIVKRLVQILGWAAGEASDMEIYSTLRKIAEEENMAYSIPEAALDFLKSN